MPPKKLPTRFHVTEIEKTDQELILELTVTFALDDETLDVYKCILRDFWRSLSLQCGDSVNLYQPKIDENDPNLFIVDNSQGLLILKPDLLLPITSLMSASFCMRKAWLTRMFDIFGEPNKAFLIGNIIHEVFQETLRRKEFEVAQIDRLFIKEIINKFTLDLYSLNMSREDIIVEMKPYFSSISNWLKIYCSKEKIDLKALFKIENLREIEDTIWSNKFGFIGKIDLTLEVKFEDKTNTTKSLVPLELKSGRHTYSTQHMGQVILYVFIMSEKYANFKSDNGFLLYLKDEAKIQPIKTNHNVFRDLIMLRNRFINYFDKVGLIDEKNEKEKLLKGPELLESDRFCSRCEHNLDCSLIYKCFDSNNPDKSIENHFSNELTTHLKETEVQFFAKMLSLLEIEKQYVLAQEEFVSFWNYRSEECEMSGIGLSKMKILHQDERKIVFGRHAKLSLPEKLLSLNPDLNLNLSLLEDRRVVISEEMINSTKTYELFGSFCKKLCLTVGQIKNFSSDQTEIVIYLEKDQINFLNPTAIYRIDFLKNLSTRAMLINFSNLLRLMSPEDRRAGELRDIVIHGRIAKYNLNDCNVGSFTQILNSPILAKLNIQQKRCILGIIKTRYSLIFGSPGSGKTQTIVALIQILHKLGFSVLVTSYTHAAVDNILLKLVKANREIGMNVDFVRMGNVKRVNKQLLEHTDYHRTKEWLETGNVNALNNFYSTVPVVSATCLGIFNHPCFLKRTFDFCIIDEASQVFLTTSLGPLFNCRNFVLVGDQKQLPPVVQSPYSRKNGLDESLFARSLNIAGKQDLVSYEDPASTSDIDDFVSPSKVKIKNTVDLKSIRIFPLFIQYRMNSVIMQVANKLTYAGRLKCGNEKVEKISMMDYLPNGRNSVFDEYDRSFLCKVISPNLQDSVVFIDTDSIVQAAEIRSSEGITQTILSSLGDDLEKSQISYVQNDFEAHCIVKIVQTLLLAYSKECFKMENIGIISPFRRQVIRLNEMFGSQFLEQNHLEINTVDQYQGRDKDVIIYSCVKSCPSQEIDQFDTEFSAIPIVDSELLKDERRLNVAVTRAKRKLIIVGNRNTLKNYLPFKNLFNVLEADQFIRLIHHDYQDIIDMLSKESNLF